MTSTLIVLKQDVPTYSVAQRPPNADAPLQLRKTNITLKKGQQMTVFCEREVLIADVLMRASKVVWHGKQDPSPVYVLKNDLDKS